MVIRHHEKAFMNVKGTIIDLETIGEFNDLYKRNDPRHYSYIQPTIFGYISNNELIQYCAEGEEDIRTVIYTMNHIIPKLDPPFFALNCNFERGVLENACKFILNPLFDVRGRNCIMSKWELREKLNIPTYGDPFNGDSSKCITEWIKGRYLPCLNHNRACLLIERDILKIIRKRINKKNY